MNDDLISQSLVVSGIPFTNKAKENGGGQEANILWETHRSVWMQS